GESGPRPRKVPSIAGRYEGARHAENRARSTSADFERMNEQAEQAGGDSGQQIDGEQSSRAKNIFRHAPDVPEAPHIEGDVHDPYVDKGAAHQPPGLATERQWPPIGAPAQELSNGWFRGRDSGSHHGGEHSDVEREQKIGQRK